MFFDYLIVAYITAIAAWYITLPLLGGLAVWAFVRRRWVYTVVLVALFIWLGISAGEFYYYL